MTYCCEILTPNRNLVFIALSLIEKNISSVSLFVFETSNCFFDMKVAHLEDAESKGGRFLIGSSKHQKPYITPTIISGMNRDMMIELDEKFGPVIGISTFRDVNEAIERANDSDFGLGAVVFGHDGVDDVAMALEPGMVGINQGQDGPAKWVGAKQSGFGYHGGKDGHRQFAQVKLIAQ
jgi:succinate-semialdehyde dehydrogenase / glutarate-semialdehyde dehydrogenase